MRGLHPRNESVDSFIFEKDLSAKKGNQQARIRTEISKRDTVVLILSAKSKDSPWVSHELGIASGMNKNIIVIKTSRPNHPGVRNIELLIQMFHQELKL